MRINWKENPVHLDHIMLYSSEPARLAAFYRDALCMKMSKNDSFIELENEGRKLLVCEGESRKLGFGFLFFLMMRRSIAFGMNLITPGLI